MVSLSTLLVAQRSMEKSQIHGKVTNPWKSSFIKKRIKQFCNSVWKRSCFPHLAFAQLLRALISNLNIMLLKLIFFNWGRWNIISVELQMALEHHVLNKLPTNTVQMAQSLSTFITTNKNDVQYREEYSSTDIPGILFTAPVPGTLHNAGGSLRSNNTEDTTTHSCNVELMVRMYSNQTSAVSSHVKQKIFFFL